MTLRFYLCRITLKLPEALEMSIGGLYLISKQPLRAAFAITSFVCPPFSSMLTSEMLILPLNQMAGVFESTDPRDTLYGLFGMLDEIPSSPALDTKLYKRYPRFLLRPSMPSR